MTMALVIYGLLARSLEIPSPHFCGWMACPRAGEGSATLLLRVASQMTLLNNCDAYIL